MRCYGLLILLVTLPNLHSIIQSKSALEKSRSKRDFSQWPPRFAQDRSHEEYNPVLKHNPVVMTSKLTLKTKNYFKKKPPSQSKWSMYLRRNALINNFHDGEVSQDRQASIDRVRSQRDKLIHVLNGLHNIVSGTVPTPLAPSITAINRGNHEKHKNSENVKVRKGHKVEISAVLKKPMDTFHGGAVNELDTGADEPWVEHDDYLDNADPFGDMEFPAGGYGEFDYGSDDIDDTAFGGFGDGDSTHSTTPCADKQAISCSQESDCACDGAYFCIAGTCSTSPRQSRASVFDSFKFAKRSAPGFMTSHVAKDAAEKRAVAMNNNADKSDRLR